MRKISWLICFLAIFTVLIAAKQPLHSGDDAGKGVKDDQNFPEIQPFKKVNFFPKDGKIFFKTASDVLLIDEEIFVVDNFKHRILIFSKEGKFKKFIGRAGIGSGDLNLPTFIRCNEGILAVKDQIGFSFFTRDGRFLNKFRMFSPGLSFAFDNKKNFLCHFF